MEPASPKPPPIPERSPRYLQQRASEAIKSGKIKESDPRLITLFNLYFVDDTKIEAYAKEHSISEVIPKLKELGADKRQISFFCQRVLEIAKGEDLPVQQPLPSVAPTMIHFFFDIDEQDQNGATTSFLANAIETNSAIVTSRFIFQGTNQKDVSISIPMEKMVENDYDIYTNGPYLVFVPKSLGATEQERLKKMDLKQESITKITLEEAWKKKEDSPTLEQFKSLFKENGDQPKLIHIAGHAGTEVLAGMNQKHYLQFLNWIKNQKCQGMLLTTCYSGGNSSKLHLPQKNPNKSDAPAPVSFPVIVRSIGDFLVYSKQDADKDTQKLMNQLQSFWQKGKNQTVAKTKRMVTEFEKEFPRKIATNQIQVYFPSASDSPGGFRALGESGLSDVITYASSQKASDSR
jgi:hypothetical protein